MKRASFPTRSAVRVLLPLVVASLLCGCTDKKKQRATVAFHTKAVRKSIDRLRKVSSTISKGNAREAGYDIRITTDLVDRALSGLPGRIERSAPDGKDRRKAAAVKAVAIFRQLRATLESLKYDQAQVNAKLDEIDKLMDQVDAGGP